MVAFHMKCWLKLTQPVQKFYCDIAGCYWETRCCAFVIGYRRAAARLRLAVHSVIALKIADHAVTRH